MQLLVKCYDNKMVKSPGGPYYRGSFMRLTKKKKKKKKESANKQERQKRERKKNMSGKKKLRVEKCEKNRKLIIR